MTQTPSNTNAAAPIVVMDRTDGLGERLCAMMNAIRFADILNADFRFYWEGDIWNPIYHKLDVKDKNAVLGQSIAPQETIFSPEFIRKFALTDYKKNDFRDFPKPPITLDALTNMTARGWRVDQNFMKGQCDTAFLKRSKLSYADAFSQLEFTPQIQELVTAAQSLKLGRFDAIHLRSGDMVFGEVRKWGQWHNKVLNPSVANDLITKSKSRGRGVVLFGQDVNVLKALSEKQDCIYVGDLVSTQEMSPTERAFFEIIVMSRANKIFAGYSGFSRAACMIGGIQATTPMSQYSREEYSDITLADLKKHAQDYHPMVAAYSFWQAYAVGKPFHNLPQQAEIIEGAQKSDPENLLHLCIRLALLYRMGRDEEAENIVTSFAKRTHQNVDAAKKQIAEQLTFKYYSTDFSHKEQFDDIRGAARRPNNTFAQYFTAEINTATKG